MMDAQVFAAAALLIATALACTRIATVGNIVTDTSTLRSKIYLDDLGPEDGTKIEGLSVDLDVAYRADYTEKEVRARLIYSSKRPSRLL